MRGILQAGQWLNLLVTVSHEALVICLDLVKAVNACCKTGSDAMSHMGFDRQVGVLNRHATRRDRELGKSPHVTSFARRHKRFRTEIPYLASDLARERRCVKRGDPVDRGLSGDEGLPERVLADAIR